MTFEWELCKQGYAKQAYTHARKWKQNIFVRSDLSRVTLGDRTEGGGEEEEEGEGNKNMRGVPRQRLRLL